MARVQYSDGYGTIYTYRGYRSHHRRTIIITYFLGDPLRWMPSC